MATKLDQIENVFRSVNREIWIVTAADDQRRGGLVATWVSEASIDRERPVVLVGIAPNHFTAELVDSSGALALHLITADQAGHAWNFAVGSGRDRDKLAGIALSTAETGAPILEDCFAWLDCRVFAALKTGDRNYYWADVLAGRVVQEGAPLTERDLLAMASDDQKQALRKGRESDVALQQPAQAAWRNDLPEMLKPGSTDREG